MEDMRKPPFGGSIGWSVLFGAGLLLVFVGERIVGTGAGRGMLDVLGILVIGGAMAARGLRFARSGGDARRIERIVLVVSAVAVAAVALYFLQSDLAAPLFGGKRMSVGWPRLAASLSALWPVVLLGGLLPLALVEAAYASMALAPRYEVGRVADAALSGVGFAAVLVAVFAFAYVASERDHKWDFAYFRTARPGEATRKIVRALDQKVQIAYFFPPANDVREQVKTYVDDLARESDKLEVVAFDHAVDPAKARELGVSGNGMVVVSKGQRREQISVGLEIEGARTQLKNLDKDVQKRLLAIARPGRTVYLTVGHGERMADPVNDTDKRFTIRALRQMMLDQSYTLRDLGAAEGLASDVPADAAVVAVIGPTKPFLPEENAALKRYVEKGGRLFVALDPEAGIDAKELLAALGLVFTPTTLANDAVYARRTYQNGDRANLVTGSFSSHTSVSTLGRLRAPLIVPGAGYLEEAKNRPKEVSIDFTVHAHSSTWNDKNGNFEFDGKEGEVRRGWELAAAVTRRKTDAKPDAKPGEGEARALVVADSDCITDPVLGSLGNAYFLVDGMKWLLGDEAIVGETTSEQDVPIAHTKSQDVIWFYSTIFLAPAVALGVGWLATRRRRPKGRKPGSSTTAGGAGGAGRPGDTKEAA